MPSIHRRRIGKIGKKRDTKEAGEAVGQTANNEFA